MQKPQNNVQYQYPEFGVEDHTFDGYVDYLTVAEYMKKVHGIDFAAKRYRAGLTPHSVESWLGAYMRKHGIYRDPREWVLVRISLVEAFKLSAIELGEDLRKVLHLLSEEFGVELKLGFTKRVQSAIDPRYCTFKDFELGTVKREPEPVVRHKAYVLYDTVKPVPDSDGALAYVDVVRYMAKRFKMHLEHEEFLRARRDQRCETMSQWFFDYWKQHGAIVKGAEDVSVTFDLAPIMQLDFTKLRTSVKKKIVDCLMMEFGNKVTFKLPAAEYAVLEANYVPSGY